MSPGLAFVDGLLEQILMVRIIVSMLKNSMCCMALLLVLSCMCVNVSAQDVRFVKVPDSYRRDSVGMTGDVDDNLLMDAVEIVAPDNPAYNVIDSVFKHKNTNNYHKNIPYIVRSYDKLTINTTPEDLQGVDGASDIPSNIFIMEQMVECVVLPPSNLKETVYASKVAGFTSFPYDIFLSSFVNMNIYDENVTFTGTEYLSPINKYNKNFKQRKYFYNILDTLVTGNNDTAYKIYFRPLVNKYFNGFDGVMCVDKATWAITYFEASLVNEDESVFEGKIKFHFAKHADELWLPTNVEMDIRSKYVAVTEGGNDTSAMLYPDINISRHLSDYDFQANIKRGDVGQIAYEITDDAYKKDDGFWDSLRVVPLTDEQKMTYHVLDSVGEKYHFDNKARIVSALTNLAIPVWKFDLPLTRMVDFNDYFGWKFGIGVETSNRLSDKASMGGYYAYGLRAKQSLFGVYANLHLLKDKNIDVNIAYTYDLTEAGGYFDYFDKYLPTDVSLYRSYLVDKMDLAKTMSIKAGIKPFRYFQFVVGLTCEHKFPTYQYLYYDKSVGSDDFMFAKLMLGVRFAYLEKYEKTRQFGLTPISSDFPVLTFYHEHGFEGIFGSRYVYNKFMLELIGQNKVFSNNKIFYDFKLGYIDRPIPYTDMFNAPAGYYNFTIYAPNAFATMRMNEFVSEKFLYVFLRYDFGPIMKKHKLFNPSPAICFNAGYGHCGYDLAQRHHNVNASTMDKGYFEAGILLNGVMDMGYTSLGVGAFYRLGYYSFDNFKDNVALKLTMTIFDK